MGAFNDHLLISANPKKWVMNTISWRTGKVGRSCRCESHSWCGAFSFTIPPQVAYSRRRQWNMLVSYSLLILPSNKDSRRDWRKKKVRWSERNELWRSLHGQRRNVPAFSDPICIAFIKCLLCNHRPMCWGTKRWLAVRRSPWFERVLYRYGTLDSYPNIWK